MDSPWGPLERVKIRALDGRPLSWREAWDAWSSLYPGRWAIQLFPSGPSLLDETNTYHLLMLGEEVSMPTSWDLGRRK